MKRGWSRATQLARAWASRGWLAWFGLWLVGDVLVVVGDGTESVTTAVGLLAVGAAAGLFLRWVWTSLN